MNRALAAQVAIVAEWPDTCDAGVYRQGELCPCDKPAIGIIRHESGAYAWPVCVHHARKDRMVPLRELLAWTGRLGRPTATAIYTSITGNDQ